MERSRPPGRVARGEGHQVSWGRDDRNVGLRVTLLPLCDEAEAWAKEHGGTVKILQYRPAPQKVQVQADDGSKKTFTGFEATWTK